MWCVFSAETRTGNTAGRDAGCPGQEQGRRLQSETQFPEFKGNSNLTDLSEMCLMKQQVVTGPNLCFSVLEIAFNVCVGFLCLSLIVVIQLFKS